MRVANGEGMAIDDALHDFLGTSPTGTQIDACLMVAEMMIGPDDIGHLTADPEMLALFVVDVTIAKRAWFDDLVAKGVLEIKGDLYAFSERMSALRRR